MEQPIRDPDFALFHPDYDLQSAPYESIVSGPQFRHSRMLLAGIQANFGLDPRLRHSGVTTEEL